MSMKVYNRDLLNDVISTSSDSAAGLGPGLSGGVDPTDSLTPFSSEKNLSESSSFATAATSETRINTGTTSAASGKKGGYGGYGGGHSLQQKHATSPRRGGKGGIGTGEVISFEQPGSDSVGAGGGGQQQRQEKSNKLQTIAANEERYRQMHEKARREAERRIQENAKRRELQFNEMFANVQNGIDRKSGILKEVDQLVEQSDRSKDKRARALYQSWNEQVYNNIQKQLQDQLNSLTTEEIEDRLNTKYDQFLQASNQKSGVFMNTNPAVPATAASENNNTTNFNTTNNNLTSFGGSTKTKRKARTIKIRTSHLNDPLKRSLLKIKEEKSISAPDQEMALMLDGQQQTTKDGELQGEREPLGRECLDTTLWGDKMLQTTPYGHQLIKEYYDPHLGSSVHLNHFQYPKFNNKVAFENFPKGKKEKPDTRARDKATFDLVGHTCHKNPQTTGGDMWLEAKGKQRRERDVAEQRQTFDLVGHTCYKQPNVTGGDMWLEAKGKQRREPKPTSL